VQPTGPTLFNPLAVCKAKTYQGVIDFAADVMISKRLDVAPC
jgi:hypothetical protein